MRKSYNKNSLNVKIDVENEASVISHTFYLWKHLWAFSPLLGLSLLVSENVSKIILKTTKWIWTTGEHSLK